ncbi:helix-turn-helix transcriptional regulator [Phreatobacter sp.]|uniref:helix-turn-helix transcriptional regulator n=1 Tax=Phreatobacter sp. TaxID=1966341 RepID=UPI003F70C0D2
MNNMLRREEVTRRTGLARSTIYKLAGLGQFPRPVKITGRASGWLETEIDAWQKSRLAERDGKTRQTEAA